MKAMLDDIEKRMPGRKDIMIRALGNIRPSHMLDPKLFDFLNLSRESCMPMIDVMNLPPSCARRPRPKSCRASGGSTAGDGQTEDDGHRPR